MAHLSLYRKYRSQRFEELIGQGHVVRTLQNALGSQRTAHAYLFTGPRGTGKTSTARLLAKALNCERPENGEPCNACEACVSITAGNCLDVFEMDAASESGVDDVREAIVEMAEYKPTFCRYKVFIIDEVHDLSAKAFDALLKTIEEPPEHIVFILATTEYHKVPPTIRSRCQKFEFHRASLQDLIARLSYVAGQEGVQVQPAALSAIARMADGGFRDALTLLEQAMLTTDGEITLQHVYDQLGLVAEESIDALLLAIRGQEIPQMLGILEEIARLGRDPRSILESMLMRLADLTRAAYGIELGAGFDAAREAALHELATHLDRERLLWLRSEIAEAHKAIRDISLPRLWLESELIRMALGPRAAPPVAEAPRAQTAPVVKPQTARSDAPSRAPAASKPAASVPPEPVVPAAPSAEPEAPVVPVPVEKTGDPEFDRAQEVWAKAAAELSTLSRTMALRLPNARVHAYREGKLEIAFLGKLDRDWFAEVPKRHGAVVEHVQKHAEAAWEVAYVVAEGARPVRQEEPRAVEVSVEGQKLAEMAKEVFGA